MSLKKLVDILNKQKLIGSMVQNQNMQKHEVIESLVQKQHSVELQNYIATQSTTELGGHLDALPLADALKLWMKIPKERENDLLWELSDKRRFELAGDRQPDFQNSKINVYELQEGRLRNIPILGRNDLEGAKPV